MSDMDKAEILSIMFLLAFLYARKQLAIMRPVPEIYGCGWIVAAIGLSIAVLSVIILLGCAAGG